MKAQALPKKNLTEREVAAVYNIGLRYLRAERMRGTGPKWIKISGKVGCRGGRILYPIDALEEWLATRPSGGGAGAAA